MIDTLFMSCLVHKLHLSDYVPTLNQEIFVYENIHVLNIHVNKFSRVPHENILTRKFCEVEITVHVSLIKRLLAMCASLFCYTKS